MNNYNYWCAGIMVAVAVMMSACRFSPKAETVDIPDGSWWTDGSTYYEAKRTGDTIHMDGYTLHEGGITLKLSIEEDGAMRVANGYFSPLEYAPVRYCRMTLANGEETELLVAYADEAFKQPVHVLQRYDGDELAYELRAVYRVLAGTYTDVADSTVVWTFYEDGTVRLSPDVTPQSYEVETSYHFPTDVIALPDGRRYGMGINGDQLCLSPVEWDPVEEEWRSGEEIIAFMRYDYHEPAWLSRQLFCGAMDNLMYNDWLEELAAEAHLSPDAFTQLNAFVIDEHMKRIY